MPAGNRGRVGDGASPARTMSLSREYLAKKDADLGNGGVSGLEDHLLQDDAVPSTKSARPASTVSRRAKRPVSATSTGDVTA